MKLDAERRRAGLPRPEYPEHLPVVARREEIAAAIRDHDVVIVAGETGSGKTTQLPKICLELERGVHGMIGHTQPRRIAARTVAARIAEELKSEPGRTVGYKIRFTDRVSADTYVKLMTDGILLAETQGDRALSAYDTLIIDEAHERSLNIDFLLGYARRLIEDRRLRRSPLKVIVTSATIDAERFARHFGSADKPAPVIEVSGRTYPVEVRYRPLQTEDEDEADQDMEDAIVAAVDELSRERAGGDILVFLPGEREIRDTAEALRKHHPKGAEILPLYARLSVEEQTRVFKPSGGTRRIVLATNVAETSLTVPGIRYVVDTGLARIKRYSYRNKVEQLQVEKISRASANQRAGRCGRVAAGVCIRLYAEEDYRARPEFSEPEILRSSLASVILRMSALKLGDIESFPFVDPPTPRMVADGYQLLAELGAVTEERTLTQVGWQLAKFPVDPRVARMIVAARQENCLKEILIIAAALSVQDPRDRPFERAEAADRAHQQFQDERSDFLAFLKIWQFYDEALKHKKSNRKLTILLHEQFLSHRRLREWRDIHGQLAALVGEMGLHENQQPATYEQIHRALLAGLLGNIGFKNEDGEYLGARGIKFTIFPGSVLRKGQPKWVVAAELAETTRLYARCVARIEPDWIEPLARTLVKRHYFDPHWEKDRAMVVAFERVTLYGLTIVPKRRVHYGPIDPETAREIFIRSALVAGDYVTQGDFLQKNHRLISDVQALEHKTRRRDVLVDEQAIYGFYAERIPAGIHNGAAFEKWRRDAEATQPDVLLLTREFLMRHAASDVTEAQFPDALDIDGARLRLKYRFDPGHPLDGITVTVPLPLLNKLQPEQFDWLVPGMIREKAGHAMKALPKQVRKQLFPLPEQVTAFLEWRDAQKQVPFFSQALRDFIHRRHGIELKTAEIADIDWPAHLRVNFRVIDDAGKELATGRDLPQLKEQLGQAAQLTFSKGAADIERDGIRVWDFGDLPAELTVTRGGRRLLGYPALVDEGDSVAIRVFDVPDTANASMRAGVVRLLRLTLKEQMKQLEKDLPGFTQAALQLRAVADADALKADVVTAIVDRAFIGEDEVPRTLKAFEAQRVRARTRLPAVRDAAARLLTGIAAEYHALSARLNAKAGALARPVADIRAQLGQLIYKGWFSATPWDRLDDLPRYLKAMQLRLDKYASNPDRDAKHAASIAQLWQRYVARLEQLRKAGRTPRAELADFRWHIEELRVSLYAQELRTPYPVSYKRLDKIWGALPD